MTAAAYEPQGIFAKLLKPVTFARFTTREFTLGTDSVVKVLYLEENSVRIQFAGRETTISIDDAVPVAWDADEQMWYED